MTWTPGPMPSPREPSYSLENLDFLHIPLWHVRCSLGLSVGMVPARNCNL